MRAFFWLALAAGCGGDSDGDTGIDALTFTEIRDNTLIPSCGIGSSCHGAGAGGLTIDENDPDAIYGALVNGTADSGNTLVVPGDSAGRYLVMKLENVVGISGDAMPPPFGLGDSEPQVLAGIKAWIDEGAPDN